jgi:hypothetical protein
MKKFKNMKRVILLILIVLVMGCQDETLPTVSTDSALKEKVKGTWFPVELSLTYNIGVSPTQKDTTVIITPSTLPLLVSNRSNPIMPFTDTLFVGSVAKPDTFFLRNRGVRQQGRFFVSTSTEDGITYRQLKIGRPTFTKGEISRWNYNITIHGLVTRAANGTATYTSASYTNAIWNIQGVTEKNLTLSLQTPSNIGNLPFTAITPQNQVNSSVWVGRSVLLKAKFVKQ